jgi:hypothetical protein
MLMVMPKLVRLLLMLIYCSFVKIEALELSPIILVSALF